MFRFAQHDTDSNEMKRLLRIFELTKNEQRVVLIVVFVLITIAFVGYERRVSHFPIRPPAVAETKQAPTPSGIKNER